MTSLEKLVEKFTRFPGVGRKSAARMVYAILREDAGFAEQLAHYIVTVRAHTKPCRGCGSYTEEEECTICRDGGRERTLLCVVEQPQDVLVFESAQVFRGLYHVLGGVIDPMSGVGPQDLSVDMLVARVHKLGVQEVVLATNPTLAGDTTALFVQQSLPKKIKISRLALGMPVGGNLEYTDRQTLARSFSLRTSMH